MNGWENNGWENIADEFYCISLKTDITRRISAKKEFERVGLKDLVKFSLQTKDTQDTKRGCFNAHINIIKDALSRNVKRLCIFEDDVVFENTNRITSMLNNTNYKDLDYDILFLGHAPLCSLYKIHPGIVKGSKFVLTHAYVLSRTGMEHVSQLNYSGKHYDISLICLKNKYAVFPMVVFQDDCPSSNDSKFIYWVLTNVRNILGCKNLCRWSEILGYMSGRCNCFLRRYIRYIGIGNESINEDRKNILQPEEVKKEEFEEEELEEEELKEEEFEEEEK